MLKLTLLTLNLALLAPIRTSAPASVLPPLTGASILVEYNVTQDSAALVFEAENDDSMVRIRILSPAGVKLLDLSAGSGQGLVLSGLRLESNTPRLGALLQAYPEGTYQIIAQGANGRRILGSATLSHVLVRPPRMKFPADGLIGVPTSGLVLSWTGNANATGYEVALEQGESDGLRIKLPPGSTSLLVPDGYLAPGTQTQLHIAAVAANGNKTITAIEFTTQ